MVRIVPLLLLLLLSSNAQQQQQNASMECPATLPSYGINHGKPQIFNPDYIHDFMTVIQRNTEAYMNNVVMVDPVYEGVRETCRNMDEHCYYWAAMGECSNKPDYMHVNCAPTCRTCDKTAYLARCAWNSETAPNAWGPGDLDRAFERIVNDTYIQQNWPVTIVSEREPWLLLFDNILNDTEADHLIELGNAQGFERSGEYFGDVNPDGTTQNKLNDRRTSQTTWCVSETCYNDPIVRELQNRMAFITGISLEHYEYLQILKYDTNQYYKLHHDASADLKDRPAGLRLLTFFFYLNDLEQGGGTQFPHLNYTVQPKRGRAVLWPSVMNNNPDFIDTRLEHQALPVIQGQKYGINAWIHQRDFKTPHGKSCQ